MRISHPKRPIAWARRARGKRTALTLGLLLVPCALVLADRPIEQRQPVDPNGSVEIIDITGHIAIVGWNRPEIEVSGSTGDSSDRVEINTSGSHTRIRIAPYGSWQSAETTRLTIHLPETSDVSAHLVNASLDVKGIKGDVSLRTVMGSLSGSVAGNLRASTVNGAVHMSAPSASEVEVRTINGDIELEAGSGEVTVTTVSGDAHVKLATPQRLRLRSVSGNLTAALALAAGTQVDAESMSGAVRLDFPVVPAADFDVQTFGGTIVACFGPQPSSPRYGPGSRFIWKSGDSHARVRIDTKGGDVHLCAGGHEPVANRSAPRDAFYVI